MNIQFEEKGRKGEFYIEDGGEKIAKIEFFNSGDSEMTIYHTEVDDKLRGKGVGEDLVERAVKHARDKGLKIVATCPFAHKLIERSAEMKDILA